MAQKKIAETKVAVRLSDAVLADIDRFAGEEGREAFIAKAIAEKLRAMDPPSGAMGRSSG